ncbi:MAG: hypothetical protein ACTSP4_11515, partial [Candidatus Hodarchaeales archaeon]
MIDSTDTNNEGEKHLKSAISQIPLPMAIMNSESTITFINPPLIKIIGTGSVNKPISQVFSMEKEKTTNFLAKKVAGVLAGLLKGNEKINLCISSPVDRNNNRIVTICCKSAPEERINFEPEIKVSPMSEKIGIAAYIIGKFGPQYFYTDNLDFLHNKEETLVKMGVFSITAIGQGHDHVHGLFGPLPVPGNEHYLTIIYTFSVKDMTNEDRRAKGKRYVMLSLVFPALFEDTINDRIRLRKILRNESQKINDYTDLTPKFFTKLKTRLLDPDSFLIDPKTRSLERKITALYKLSSDLLRFPEKSLEFIMKYAENVL